MDLESLVGQTLDEKYKIERELGRGGMGAVYLATHIGTERPVAVKVIVPQFMQRAEFVERFRREARAAGRLRHPNVVDVTDFGFAETAQGRVAYLVMEYLDGCTLGEILEEEKQLPLSWTLDILEQVCSAVDEAHRQGIIHRDLKPDNIWLEPNQRGGYTVKVLDFGIAKLEAAPSEVLQQAEYLIPPAPGAQQTQAISRNATAIDERRTPTVSENKAATVAAEGQTIAENRRAKTFLAEAGTLIQPSGEVGLESGTAIMPPPENPSESGTAILTQSPNPTVEPDDKGTKLMSAPIQTGEPALEKVSTSELTRVGAVLGTPLYMSPEQCRGEHLDARSDVYSLGVIAYQMLSGRTPFGGDFMEVMNAHKESVPPVLEAEKVRRKVKKVIHAALSKKPDQRPPTAQALASEMRAHSEGIGALLQRAMIIYSQHLPKFLLLALLIYSPIALAAVAQVVINLLDASQAIGGLTSVLLKGVFGLASMFFSFFCGYLILGTTTWTVTQILAAPLRPVALRPAFITVKNKWRTLAATGTLSTVLSLLGYCLVVPGIIMSVLWALVAPVIMMENLRGRAALRRSKTLAMRSLRTTTAAIFIMFLVPMLIAGLISFLVSASVKSFAPNPPIVVENAEGEKSPAVERAAKDDDVLIKLNEKGVTIEEKSGGKKAEETDMGSRVRSAVRESLTQILLLPITFLFGSFSAVVISLLYLKTRQAGGESMQELLAQFSDGDQPERNWQRRVRQRLEQSGKLLSKS